MQNIENIYEIDLSSIDDSKMLADTVIASLEDEKAKNTSIKLKLGDNKVTQSQMVFIRSLIESYGSKLGFVETSNILIKDICLEMGIDTTKERPELINITSESFNDIQNAKLDDLREEFKSGFEQKEEQTQINTEEEKPKAVELIKDEPSDEPEIQKQVIGVYRTADEKENAEFLQDEEVDFYAVPTDETVVIDTKDTIYINQTLRNGQTVDYDGNVVIIGDCHPGSEIKATGDITVWGVLGSIAHAGAKGNVEAKIRALKMNAVQLRIANCYSRRPDGGNIPYIVKSSTFTPEEARIVDDNIVLFKMAQN